MWRRLTVFPLLLALTALAPLAYLSPPDPTWISGVYDAGDYDDVVVAVTAIDPAPQDALPAVPRPRQIVLGPVLPSVPTGVSRPPLRAFSVRAPPTA